MKRIVPAAAVAVAIHGLLFTISVDQNAAVRTRDFPNTVQFTLVAVSPVKKTMSRSGKAVCPKKKIPVKAKKPALKKRGQKETSNRKTVYKKASPKRKFKSVKTRRTRIQPTPEKISSSIPDRPKRSVAKKKPAQEFKKIPQMQKLPHSANVTDAVTGIEKPAIVQKRKPPATLSESGKQAGKDETPDQPRITQAIPAYRQNPPPKYPLIARRRGYEGTVLINVLVDSKGKAGEVKIVQSSGHRILDRAACNSVKRWVFVPGRKGDETVSMWVTVPIRFSLK